jgi:hypothetical protein
MAFATTRSQSLAVRSLQSRTASFLLGGLFLMPLANVTFAADEKKVIDKYLNDAITLTQNLVVSASEGCSGGSHGVPPVSWGNLQPHANAAQNALNGLRQDLTGGQTGNAAQKIDTAETELTTLINGLHDSCSGGAHGVDPIGYAGYVLTVATVKKNLDFIKDLLAP